MIYLIIGVAGFVGALLRFYVDSLFPVNLTSGQFPISTFIVNMLGSFLLGALTAFVAKSKYFKPYIVTGIGTGLIGSFTTFSTFSLEVMKLIRNGYFKETFLYILLSIIGGVFFAVIGLQIVKKRGNQHVDS